MALHNKCSSKLFFKISRKFLPEFTIKKQFKSLFCSIIIGTLTLYVSCKNLTILGSKDKIKDIHRICKIYNFELDKIIYVGNDINDLEAMKECGISLAVNDAIKEVKQVADFVLLSKGGEMVAREILNEFLEY